MMNPYTRAANTFIRADNELDGLFAAWDQPGGDGAVNSGPLFVA